MWGGEGFGSGSGWGRRRWGWGRCFVGSVGFRVDRTVVVVTSVLLVSVWGVGWFVGFSIIAYWSLFGWGFKGNFSVYIISVGRSFRG